MGTAARVLPMPIIRNRKPRRIPLLSRALAVPYGRPRRSGHRVWGPRVRGITAIFKKMCAATGIKDLQFPNLRREAPSQLFEKGLGIESWSSRRLPLPGASRTPGATPSCGPRAWFEVPTDALRHMAAGRPLVRLRCRLAVYRANRTESDHQSFWGLQETLYA